MGLCLRRLLRLLISLSLESSLSRVRVGAKQCGNREREGKAVGFRVAGGFAVFAFFKSFAHRVMRSLNAHDRRPIPQQTRAAGSGDIGHWARSELFVSYLALNLLCDLWRHRLHAVFLSGVLRRFLHQLIFGSARAT